MGTEEFAYFFVTEDHTRIKIGHSVDPMDRRGDLQTGSPEEQDFDYTIPDLIADHMRDGLDHSLVHHKLLEWWRKGFAFDPERERTRLPLPWSESGE